MEEPFTAVRDGVAVVLRVTPRAGRDRIVGVVEGATGTALKVTVGAPAEDGKANAAVVRLLAGAWDLPRARLSIVSGHTARSKRLLVSGDPAPLLQRLRTWLATLASKT